MAAVDALMTNDIMADYGRQQPNIQVFKKVLRRESGGVSTKKGSTYSTYVGPDGMARVLRHVVLHKRRRDVGHRHPDQGTTLAWLAGFAAVPRGGITNSYLGSEFSPWVLMRTQLCRLYQGKGWLSRARLEVSLPIE